MTDDITPGRVYTFEQAQKAAHLEADDLTCVLNAADVAMVSVGQSQVILGETLLYALKLAAGHSAIEVLPGVVYTLEAAAALLRVSPDTLRRLVRDGKLRVSPVGRKKVILGEELLRFLRNGE